MPIHYTQESEITAGELAELFVKSGINRPTEDNDRLRKMIEGADLIVTAWDDHRLVGVARALTDFCYCCYLSDLAVDRDYQNRGIGKELIAKVQEIVGDECSTILISAPSAMPFYAKTGMEAITNGWIVRRKK